MVDGVVGGVVGSTVGGGCGASGFGVSVGAGIGVDTGVDVGLGRSGVGDSVYAAVGVIVNDTGNGVKKGIGGKLDDLGVPVGCCPEGLDVGLAVGVTVGEGEAVGVEVDVVTTRAVDVAVAVGMPPPLTLPASNETTVTRDTKPTANKLTPSRRSTRSLAAPIHRRKPPDFNGEGNMVVSVPGDAVLSAFTWEGKGEANNAWCISATF